MTDFYEIYRAIELGNKEGLEAILRKDRWIDLIDGDEDEDGLAIRIAIRGGKEEILALLMKYIDETASSDSNRTYRCKYLDRIICEERDSEGYYIPSSEMKYLFEKHQISHSHLKSI